MQYTPGRMLLAAGPGGYVLLADSDAARSLVETVILPELAVVPAGAHLARLVSGKDARLERLGGFAAVLTSASGTRIVLRGGRFAGRLGDGRWVTQMDGAPVDEQVTSVTTVTVGADVEALAHLQPEWLSLQAGAVLADRGHSVLSRVLRPTGAGQDNGRPAPDRSNHPTIGHESAAAPEHTVSHQLLFGVPAHAATLAVDASAENEQHRAQRDGKHDTAGPANTSRQAAAAGLEHTLPPPHTDLGDARAADSAPVAAVRSSAVQPSVTQLSTALPELPAGWVSRRTPRTVTAAPPAPPTPSATGSSRGFGFLRPKPAAPPGPTTEQEAPVDPAAEQPAARLRSPRSRPPAAEPSDETQATPKVLAPVTPSVPAGFPARRWDAGLTVMARDLPAPAVAVPEASDQRGGLLAVCCPGGHLGPPDRPACRVCGLPIVDRAVTRVRRPRVGRLCRQGAPDLPLVGTIVFGRQPEWPAAQEQPLLITLEDPEQSISRSHLEVSVRGWDVTVTDLGGRNGTVVQVPSGRRQQLIAHQPVVIAPSTVITLADVVSVWFEVP